MKLADYKARDERIAALMEGKVPPHDDLEHRIEMLLDAKGDVEKDLEFEKAKPATAVVNAVVELLDAADVDGPRGYHELPARIEALLETTAEAQRAAEVREDFLHLDGGDDAEVFMVRHGTILPAMTRAVIDRVKKLAVPWRSLAESQQGDLINSIERVIAAQFTAAMRIITAEDHPVVRCSLVDFTTKGTTVKIKLETVKTIENLTALGGVGDRQLDIVFVEQTVLDDGSDKGAQPDADQPALPLERAIAKAEPQPGPEGDTDLAEAGEAVAAERAAAEDDEAEPVPEPFDGGAPAWGEDLPHDEDDIIPLASDDDDDDDVIEQPADEDVDQRSEEERHDA